MSMLAGVTRNYFIGIESGVTLEWVIKVWNDYRHTILLSIQIALACLLCTLLLECPRLCAGARQQQDHARNRLLVMPVAIPGLATALALIVTFGNWGGFRRSWLIILVGHVLFTLPFMVRSVLAVLASIDLKSLEEGARSLGANFTQRFFGIVLPNCRAGIVAGSLMVVTLSIGEFNMTLLLHTPLTPTLPVGLADAYASLDSSRFRLYADLFRHHHSAADRAPMGVAAGQSGAIGAEPAARKIGAQCIDGYSNSDKRLRQDIDDGTRALEPIDLEIAAGETIVLLGPSGCGKTTTLRIIAGLESPDTGGQVLFDGIDVTPVPIERRNVGMVFQSYALFPNMSVAGNVEYGLKVRGMPAAQRSARVREMLAMMHIEALAQRQIDQLSGGQRQRVALARAIATRPRVLLLDEPLTALDAKLRDSLRLEIDRLLRSLNITTVYVTHDQAEAMALGDRIAVMEHGRIAQIGSPQDIYCAPASSFVADFIGTMNRISGKRKPTPCVSPAAPFRWARTLQVRPK